MKVLVIVPGSEQSEAGVMPDASLFEAMHRFNEKLAQAGVMLAAEGLQPSSKGKRVRFGDTKTVRDGPFAETKEAIAGFWLWQVRSLDEAVEWIKQAPFGGGVEIELRPIYETDDLPAPEHVKEGEKRLRAQAAAKS